MQLQDSLTDHFDQALTLPESGIQSHASNLALLANGDVLCTWFSGSEEGKSDISIYYSRLPAGTDVWTLPQQVSDNPGRSDQNPMFFQAPTGQLWLLFTSQDGGNQDTAIIKRRISEDDGHTWGPETVLFPGQTGLFIRQDVQVTPAGQWVLPVFHCVIKNDGKPWDGSYDYSAVIATADEGKTWQEYPVPDSLGCVHMNIQPLPDDTYVAFYRSRWADNIYRSTSKDALHWTVPEKTVLPNNNSSIQFTALADGKLAIAYNDASKLDAKVRRTSLYSDGLEDKDDEPDDGVLHAFWGAPRAPMTVALSSDGGLTWPDRRNVAIGDGFALTNNSKDKKNREFSYPSIKQASNGDLLLTFTYFRQKIAYLRFSEDWVKSGKKEA